MASQVLLIILFSNLIQCSFNSRFNYVAQPEDGVTNFYEIVEYDIWSVKWGYTYFDG